MQNWVKLGHLYTPDGSNNTWHSHASLPFVGRISDHGIIDVYFSSRNRENKSHIVKLLLDLEEKRIIKEPDEALLSPGEIGMFDHDGVMGCQYFEVKSRKYISYIGWNLGQNVPFRNAIGIAEISNNKLIRIHQGPVLDRSKYDPCFVASHCIVEKDNSFLMYYLSCIRWKLVNGMLKHYYHIKIAFSENALEWEPTGLVALDFIHPDEYAISTPRVRYHDGIYSMWFSYRSGDLAQTYRIGYAESVDAIHWQRKDALVNLPPSIGGWDNEMICYPYVFDYKENTYMLYNGNGYGKTGFGLAILNS
jgi:hypothetical protein